MSSFTLSLSAAGGGIFCFLIGYGIPRNAAPETKTSPGDTSAPRASSPSEIEYVIRVNPPPNLDKDRQRYINLGRGDLAIAEREARMNEYPGRYLEWVARGAASTDTEKALAWASRLINTNERSEAYRAIVEEFLENGDLEGATAIVERLPEGKFRNSARFALFEKHLADGELSKALHFVEDIGAAHRIAEKMADSESDDQLWQALEEVPSISVRHAVASAYYEKIAESDPLKALALVAKDRIFIDQRRTSPTYEYLGWQIGEKEPREGLDAGRSIYSKKSREIFYRELGITWAEQDRSAAIDFLIDRFNELDDPDIGFALEGAMFSFAAMPTRDANRMNTDFDVNIVNTSVARVSNPERRDYIASELVARIAWRSYQRAAELIDARSEQQAEWAAGETGKLMNNWITRSPKQATDWLEGHSSGPVKDAGIIALVERVVEDQQDFELGLAWAGRIQDEGKRDQVIAQIETRMSADPARSTDTHEK